MNYAELPPHTSIGYHRHRQDEEIYVILEGQGRMTVNEEVREVRQGDVLINRPEWAHSLENHTDEVLKVLVFEVDL